MSLDVKKRAVVLLSGGLDSATCLAFATKQQFACYALSINYGQRHQSELAAATKLAKHYVCEEHRVLDLDVGQFGGSALTDDKISVPAGEQLSEGIPVTYVPARNTLMLAAALGWAEVLGANDIFVGVNAVDYSGYPDCRPEYIDAFNALAKLATKNGVEGNPITVRAPLQNCSKEDIIKMGVDLNVDYALTVSCYQADESGAACGTCDACRLRKDGFVHAGVPDPTRYY